MNCQEVLRTNQLCHCCRNALQVKYQSADRNKNFSDLRSPRDCSSAQASFAHAHHGRSGSRYQYQTESEDECSPMDERTYVKYSATPGYNPQGRQGQPPMVDRSTMQTLHKLRERACKLIDGSDASGLSEEERFRPHTRQREPCMEESVVRRRAQTLNYTPQSEFLKRMKRQSEERNISSSQLEEGDRHHQECICQCCQCNSSNGGTPYSVTHANNERPRNRTTPFSDMSSIHDPSRCFRAWRLRNVDDHQADNFGTFGDQIISEECQRYMQETRSDGDTGICDPEVNGFKGHKGGHVSRSTRRRRRSRGGRRKSHSSTTECESPLEFEPSLKRPHANSCERCWRYASPARSPVNKPSQRFDPNFRRSHSVMNLKSDEEGHTSGIEDQRKCEEDRVVQFESTVIKRSKSVPRVKSADNVGRTSEGKSENLKRQDEKWNKHRGTREKSAVKREEKDCDASLSVKPKRKGERRPKASASFHKQNREESQSKAPRPLQCSPSMFNKSDRSSGKKFVTSGLKERNRSGRKSRRVSKERPSSSCQTQTPNETIPYPPAQSTDREFRLCDRSCLDELREEICKEFQNFRSCRCPEPVQRGSSFASYISRQGGAQPEYVSHRPPMTPTDFHYNGHQARGETSIRTTPRGYENEVQGSQMDASRRRSGEYYQQSEEARARLGVKRDNACNCEHCIAFMTLHESHQMRTKAEILQPSADEIPEDMPVTLWDRERSRDNCKARQFVMSTGKCDRHSGGKNRQEMRDISPENLSPSNPRKYCVFYMTKSKENRDDDVEVLIEELTQGKRGKGRRAESLRDKMKKMTENRSDSMALRFQKGMTNICTRPESNRVLYF